MKVVLIGDSIRGGYQPFVAGKLEGEATVWGPEPNCRHSLWALDHFEEWVAGQKPDVVHVNFGIHDAVLMDDGEHQILLDQYCLCLRRFIARAKQLDGTTLIWATTTPMYSPAEGVPMAQWSKAKAIGIDDYNAAALKIVNAEGLPVDDLHAAVMAGGFEKCLSEDGCHMTEFGNEVLSDAVVESVRRLM